jgi:hypothetical protein
MRLTIRPVSAHAAPTLSPWEATGLAEVEPGIAVGKARAIGDAGFAPLSLVLGLGLLVIPVLLLVLTIPTWIDRSVDARDAAANAARALATADTWADGQAAARQAVTEIATNDGISPADIQAGYSGSLVPGGTVTATITVTIPAGVVPGVGHYGTVHYTASSTQHVDSYRGDDG